MAPLRLARCPWPPGSHHELGLLKSGLIPPHFLAVVGDQASHGLKLAYTRGRGLLRVGPCLPLRKINGRKSDRADLDGEVLESCVMHNTNKIYIRQR